MKNKKGSIFDVMMWVILSIIIVIFFAVLYFTIGKQLLPAMQTAFSHLSAINGYNVSNSTTTIINNGIQGISQFKWIAYAILVVMALNIFIGYFLVKVHPAFFILYFFIAIVCFLAAVPIANSYSTLYNSGGAFAQTLKTDFSGASFIILQLPVWAIVISLIGIILLLAGIPRGGGGGPTA